MSVSTLPLYTQEGRLRGHYVYMLLCQDDGGPIYIKIGMSKDPLSRLNVLRIGCPVSPKSFAYFETRAIQESRRVESALHMAFAKWNTHLEWFMFSEADKAEFNAVLKTVLTHYASPGRPYIWNKVSIKEILKIRARNKKLSQILFARSSQARKDFTKDQRC